MENFKFCSILLDLFAKIAEKDKYELMYVEHFWRGVLCLQNNFKKSHVQKPIKKIKNGVECLSFVKFANYNEIIPEHIRK